jgi:beta-phosphoglucomutase
MRRYEAILFDFDGVLLDSEPIHFACWREVLLPLGIDLDWETYRARCIGVADRDMAELLATLSPVPISPERIFAEYPRKNRDYVARVAARPPFPEATRRLLVELFGRYQLAVVSSSGRSEVEPLLVAGGLRPLFGAVICGEDVVRHKPDPEPYLLAARQLGVRRALVVEDSEPGEASGRAAGFDVVRIAHPDQLSEALSERLDHR